MTETLQNEIISLIPSESLKAQIRLSGTRFSDDDLLAIAYQYAPDFDSRIEWLQRLEVCFTGELREYTSRLIRGQQRMLESFTAPDENAVFELHIQETPDAYDERYICESYDAALRMIPLFYREYEFARETDVTRYTIVKRRVLSEKTGFSEDSLGEMELLPGLKVYSAVVWADEFGAEGCHNDDYTDWDCEACGKPCARNREIFFPPFAGHGDAVRCTNYSGKKTYGIVLADTDRHGMEYYVIPLDSVPVARHDFINIYDAHMHVPAPRVERIEADSLPETMREDYRACRQYLMENTGK